MYRYEFLKFIYILLISSCIYGACDKPTNIGGDVFGGIDAINSSILDTFTIQTQTVWQDTFSTKNMVSTLLGTQNDNRFGISVASIFVQPDLPTNNLRFAGGDLYTLDSIVLTLDVITSYGDTTLGQDFYVYELCQDLDATADYNSYSSLATYSVPIGQKLNYIYTSDSIASDGVSTTGIIRIPLSASYGYKFLLSSGTSDFADAASFHNLIKGLQIINPTDLGKCIYSIKMVSNFTGLRLYYHTELEDSLSYFFPMSKTNGAYFTRFSHNYNGTLSSSAIQNACTATGNEIETYMQSTQSCMAFVKFPYIHTIPDIIMNKAVLEVYAINDSLTTDKEYTLPQNLLLQIPDTTCDYDNSTLLQYSNDFFGIEEIGQKKTVNRYGIDLTAYQFVVTPFVQKMLDEKTFHNGILINTYFPNMGGTVFPNSAFRVPIYGGNHPLYKPKLIVTYTQIN